MGIRAEQTITEATPTLEFSLGILNVLPVLGELADLEARASLTYRSKNKFLLVDGVLSLTIGPESSQKLWQLIGPQAIYACRPYNDMFIAPAEVIPSSTPVLTLGGKEYHIIDYIHTTPKQTSRVLCQGVYRPKPTATPSTASLREGLSPPIFFTIGGRVGIKLEVAARKTTDVLDRANFPAQLRNKTTGYLCIHVSLQHLPENGSVPNISAVARI